MTQIFESSRPHHLPESAGETPIKSKSRRRVRTRYLGAEGNRAGSLFPIPFPGNVYKEKTRHGKEVYYFRLGQGRRIRLPSPDSKWFGSAYGLASAGVEDHTEVRQVELERATERAIRARLKEAVRQARNRARRKKVPFNLTQEWVLTQAEIQQYRCLMSGVPFYLKLEAKSKHNPYAPSLDRIIPALGYTIGNVRIILFSMNMMMMDWGEEVFAEVATGYQQKIEIRQRRILPGDMGPHLPAEEGASMTGNRR